MKPFATLGSEISKVRDRVRRGAESLRPAKVAGDVRDQRDRLLAKLGEQTFRLIAERKLVVPKLLQESVERLAALLGVQLPVVAPSTPPPADVTAAARDLAMGSSENASHPFQGDEDEDEPAAAPPPPAGPVAKVAAKPASTAPNASQKKSKKNGGKRRGKR